MRRCSFVTSHHVLLQEADPPDIAGLAPSWCICVFVDGVAVARGLGKNKKLAKQEAADRALTKLFNVEPILNDIHVSELGRVCGSDVKGTLDAIKSQGPVADIHDKV